MREFKIVTPVRELSYNELEETDRLLIDKAREAAAGAYAPFSKFHVGAAILMENGEIATGNNQENAAYPSGTCAERTALFHASAIRPGMAMRKIAVAAGNVNADGKVMFQKTPISPCGSCRQALMEYEHRFGPIEVILYGSDKIYILPSVGALLPFSFTEF